MAQTTSKVLEQKAKAEADAKVAADAKAKEEADAKAKANTKSKKKSSGKKTDEKQVKSGFSKMRISAVCDGVPFRGGYKSLQFDDDGIAVITRSDAESVKSLSIDFPEVEINEIEEEEDEE